MKYALTYLAGAFTVAGFVLATGGTTTTAFWLGFALAIVLSALVVYGFRKRLFSHKPVKLEAVKNSRPVKTPALASDPDPVIADTVSALVNFRVPKAEARRAVEATYRPGVRFEDLFRGALQQKRAA